MSFREVALGFFGLFLLIGPFGRLEHLICKTFKFTRLDLSVSGPVLSLWVKNVDAI
jgi:hypothetical protein